MKKFLLFAFAAVMAVSASAQQKFDKSVVFNRPTQKYAPMALTSDIKVSDFAKPDFKSLATKKSMKKANEYGLTAASFDKSGWIEVEEGEICNQTGTVTLALNEEGNLDVTGLCFGFANVEAYFDEDNLQLVIPGGQYCYEHSEYGRMVMYPIEIIDDRVYPKTDETGEFLANITYTLDVENLVFEADGMFMIYMIDYIESHPEGPAVWAYGYGSPLKAPNAIQSYLYHTGRPGGSWAEEQAYAYVEDWGFSLSIDNFIELSTVSMDVDSETNTLAMATGQSLIDNSYGMSEADVAAYGKDLHIVGTTRDAEGYIYTNEEADAVNLSFYDGRTLFSDEVFIVQSKLDADQVGYRYGYIQRYTLLLMRDDAQFQGFNPDIWDGITELKQTKKVGEGKKFNLMGQQINRAHKGIMLSDGKKYLRK